MAKKKLKKKTTSKASSKNTLNQLADPVLNSARDIVRAGLGALSVAQKEGGKIAEQGSALFETLVKEGAKLEKEGRDSASEGVESVRKGVTGVRDELESRIESARKQAEDRWDKLESVFEERVARVMANLGVPTADDVNKLAAQVESLTQQVAHLSREKAKAKSAAAPKQAAKKKAAPAKAKTDTDVVYHLVPRDEDWAITLEGADKDLSVHGTKKEALDAARKVAQSHEPSRLVVHKADGTIQTSYAYGEDA